MENQVMQHLHMNGGTGVTSYSSNSLVQKKVINMTRPVVEEAILDILSKYYTTTTITTISPNNKMSIADLGCSSGPNTFLVVSYILDTIYNKYCHQESGGVPPEVLVFLNDLPGNDFNTIFKYLESFSNEVRESKRNGLGPFYFVAGMPGTFYGRLFPTQTLHFVHSSYSLQWISQVPPGIGKNNKGNIYISISSPPSVIEAYFKQFERDFSVFLKCRSEELVEGGRMVLTLLGRRSSDPTSKECYFLELLAMALNDMVSEGMIEEEKLELFNMPLYFPCPEEVNYVIDTEGSFVVNQVKTSESNVDGSEDGGDSVIDKSRSSFNIMNTIRAASEPLLAIHFGEEIIDKIFKRYQEIVEDIVTGEKITFTNVVFSLTKG